MNNYTAEQRYRDKNVYGAGAVVRIEKHINEGLSISGSRSLEADRIFRFREVARNGGTVGGVIGGVAGAYLSTKYSKTIAKKFATDEKSETVVYYMVSGAFVGVGKSIGSYLGKAVVMMVGGYSYGKYR